MIRRFSNVITILILLLSLWGSASGGVVGTDGVEVTGVKEEPIILGPVLDDFNDGGNLNNWGHGTGSFVSTGSASCVDSRDAGSPEEGAFCLKLDYNVSTPASYAGYFSQLGGKDLSSYTSISFWVKGTVGGEFFKIELKNNSADSNRNRAAVYITDYLDGGVTTSWQEVTIPFHNFVNLDSWNSMVELVFVFENYQSGVNGSPPQGTIYIDRISFGGTSVNEVRIDYFGDKLGTCALGGNIGDMPTENFTHSFISGQYMSPPSALESSYNVTSDPWGGQFMIFGGGADGWTEVPHNFSAYNYVTLSVKAKSASENPKVLKVEIVDATNKAFWVRLLDITTSWQRYLIPLSILVGQGLDKSSIKKMTFVYEDWRIQQAGGSKQGVLYIDDLRFDVDTE